MCVPAWLCQHAAKLCHCVLSQCQCMNCNLVQPGQCNQSVMCGSVVMCDAIADEAPVSVTGVQPCNLYHCNGDGCLGSTGGPNPVSVGVGLPCVPWPPGWVVWLGSMWDTCVNSVPPTVFMTSPSDPASPWLPLPGPDVGSCVGAGVPTELSWLVRPAITGSWDWICPRWP